MRATIAACGMALLVVAPASRSGLMHTARQTDMLILAACGATPTRPLGIEQTVCGVLQSAPFEDPETTLLSRDPRTALAWRHN